MKIKNNVTCNYFMYILQQLARVIAILVAFSLITAASVIIFRSFGHLIFGGVDKAIQDSLFVLILLELFYVVCSFVKYNSVNVGLIVNVGIIATVKQMVLKLDTITWSLALAFAAIFLSLGFLYWMESQYYKQYKEEAQDILK